MPYRTPVDAFPRYHAAADPLAASEARAAVLMEMRGDGSVRIIGGKTAAVINSTVVVGDSTVVVGDMPANLISSSTVSSSLYADTLAAMRACPLPIMLTSLLIRQVCMPLIGLLLVHAAVVAGALDAHNRTLLFVLLIEAATPTALNVSIMCTMSGTGERALAALMVVQHLALLPTLTVWSCVFIWYIGRVSA